MQHDPLVCVEDAIKACELISQFIQGMKEEDFYNDAMTDGTVKSPLLRHSRAGGNPERIEMTRFPPTRE